MDKKTVEDHFEAHAEEWLRDSYEGDGYTYPTAYHRARIVSRILGSDSGPLTIADLGCGGGDLAILLARQGHRVCGVDQVERMVEIAEARKAELPENIRNNVTFTQGELENSGLPEQEFDAVTSMGVIGYLDNDGILFRTAHDLLKPGGLFLVSCRNRLFNMNSLSFRTLNEIEAGTAPALIEEMETYCAPVPAEDAAAFLTRLEMQSAALGEAGASGESKGEEPVAGEQPHIEARQHTPKGLNETARGLGFTPKETHGVHPHLIDPRLNRLLPPKVFNGISTALEALEHLPVSLLWSSVFISVFEKDA